MRVLSVAAFAITLVAAGLAGWQITKSPGSFDDAAPYRSPSATGGTVQVSVQEGTSPKEFGKRLEDAGVIDSATQFQVLAAILGYEQKLQAGDYEFNQHTPALDALYRIRNGVISSRTVTVVEGWRLEQIADEVAKQGISRDAFLSAALVRNFNFDFLNGVNGAETVEGYIFPATYPVLTSDTAQTLLTRMLKTFDDRVPADVRRSAASSGLTLHETLTLASIIEREAKVPSERPIMAQVFLSRLRQGIPLEADPTVQFALAQDPANVRQFGYWKQDLTRADLETGSPYNTYQNSGLPPGPICSPRLDSITAVINPANTNYLYFVAKPDGSHAFASTLEEHQRNIEKYSSQ